MLKLHGYSLIKDFIVYKMRVIITVYVVNDHSYIILYPYFYVIVNALILIVK